MEELDLHELYDATQYKRASKRGSTYMVIALLGSIAWLAFSFYQVVTLRKESLQLRNDISLLQRERDQVLAKTNEEIEKRNIEIDNLTALRSALLPNGEKRKQAIIMAIDLQKRQVKYLRAGTKPEGGLDISQFITYILSQPEIGIVKNPAYCNQGCLMDVKRSGISEASSLSELRQGDLIFYELDLTMMYLGNGKAIGMLWDQGIQVKDVHIKTKGTDVDSPKIRGYGRVPYGD